MTKPCKEGQVPQNPTPTTSPLEPQVLLERRITALAAVMDLQTACERLTVRARLAAELVSQAGLATPGAAAIVESTSTKLSMIVDQLRFERDVLIKASAKTLRDPALRP